MSDYSLGGLLACCRLFVLFPRVMIKACNENNKNISVEITQIQSKKEKKKNENEESDFTCLDDRWITLFQHLMVTAS